MESMADRDLGDEATDATAAHVEEVPPTAVVTHRDVKPAEVEDEDATTVVLVESADGFSERPIDRPVHRRERVVTLDGQAHEHVADAPDGRWIYRPAR